MKLNIGCGDKILDGYVNVDVVDERAGNKPDVNCDVRTLESFPEECADEILAVHLIEHFYNWEVQDLLEVWYNTLKPGGTLILETPSLQEACRLIALEPSLIVQNPQRTMWPLYGDPQHKDPLMCHKWLYTPQTLAYELNQAGFVSIEMKPAQFKLREPRDFRLVGYKPGGNDGLFRSVFCSTCIPGCSYGILRNLCVPVDV